MTTHDSSVAGDRLQRSTRARRPAEPSQTITGRSSDPDGWRAAKGAATVLLPEDTELPLRESEQMVEALRRAGKDVRFVVFPDEGHRRDYGNWRNALQHYREVELFLGDCLGGRVGPPPAN